MEAQLAGKVSINAFPPPFLCRLLPSRAGGVLSNRLRQRQGQGQG